MDQGQEAARQRRETRHKRRGLDTLSGMNQHISSLKFKYVHVVCGSFLHVIGHFLYASFHAFTYDLLKAGIALQSAL